MKRIAALIFALVVALCSVTSVFAAGYGDTNGNGKVDIIDVTTIQRHIARIIEISDEAIDLSDVDGDGKLTIIDCTNIQRYIAKDIDRFPVEDMETQPPTVEPTELPTQEPTQPPTVEPTELPTQEPTQPPTVEPTEPPTQEPTQPPTVEPTEPPTQEPTQAPDEEGQPNEFELEVLRLVNIEREKEGLHPLEFAYFIYDCAKLRAEEVDTEFSHIRPDGTPFYTVYDEFGVTEHWYALGENIAWGHSTAERVVKDWMNSPGHRANILSEDYDYLAVGTYECTEQRGTYATVQLFWGKP